jgi:hypothetical protein
MDYHQNAKLMVQSRERMAQCVLAGTSFKSAAAFHVSPKNAPRVGTRSIFPYFAVDREATWHQIDRLCAGRRTHGFQRFGQILA